MKTIGKIFLMFLLIAGISSCEKQSAEPSLVGTTWLSSDVQPITVRFLMTLKDVKSGNIIQLRRQTY